MATKKKKTFEEAVARLEEIVNELENTQVSLDESLKLYREGVELTEICNEKLSTAENEVMILRAKTNGDVIEEVFDGQEEYKNGL